MQHVQISHTLALIRIRASSDPQCPGLEARDDHDVPQSRCGSPDSEEELPRLQQQGAASGHGDLAGKQAVICCDEVHLIGSRYGRHTGEGRHDQIVLDATYHWWKVC